MLSDVILLYCDNNSAIALAKESRSHLKFKHIEWWFYLIHDYLEKKYIKVQRVDTIDNMVNLLTKQLQKTEVYLKKIWLRFVINWL